MRYALGQINRGIGILNRLASLLLGLMLLIMAVLIFWQVFARFMIGSPSVFSEEISRFLMVWLTFLGAAVAYRRGTLISVDIVLEYAGKTVSKFFRITVVTASTIFALVLINEGFDISDRVSFQTAPSTRISMMWLYLAVPVGRVVVVINSIGLLIDELIEKEE